jgi:hypothetical protein
VLQSAAKTAHTIVFWGTFTDNTLPAMRQHHHNTDETTAERKGTLAGRFSYCMKLGGGSMIIPKTFALIALLLFLGGCCGPYGRDYREASRARREMLHDLRDARSQYRNDLREARDDFRRRANEARMELRRSLRRHHDFDADFQ